MFQEKVECALVLLDYTTVDVHITDKFGLTPLHIACVQGCVPVVHKLDQRDANMNAEDQHGRKPLQAAQTNGQTAVVNLIKSKEFQNTYKHRLKVCNRFINHIIIL